MSILLYNKAARLAAVCSGLVLVAACATPDARIKKNQELFDALPVEAQTQIRQGKVGLGFSPDMVRLAVGEPDRKAIRTDAAGRTEVWSYTRYEAADGQPVYTGFYHRAYPGYRYYGQGVFIERTEAREFFRVEFVDGLVTSVQEQQK